MNSKLANSSPAPANGRPPSLASILFDRAREELESRDYEALLQTSRRIVDECPQKASGFNVLAQALVHLDRIDEALEAVQRGLAIHPGEPKLESMLFRLLLTKQDSEAAAALSARLASEGRPIPVAALSDLATFQMQVRNFDGAKLTGERLVSKHPERASSFCLLAQALLCLNRADEAIEVLGRAKAIHPENPRVHKLLYHAQVLRGETEAALEAALSLIHMQPSDERAQYWVYLSLMSLARLEDAEEHLAIARDQARAFDWGKHSSHFNQYKRLARRYPPIAAAWEHGLQNRPTCRADLPKLRTDIPTIQYWSQGRPPADVLLAIAEWNGILVNLGLPETTVYDRETAGSWIATNAPEFQRAFSDAFHFAMEADIFRIAYASKRRCIYIDIDSWPLAHAKDVLHYGVSQPHSMLYFRAGQPQLNNSFFVAGAGCVFFRELARQCASIDVKHLPQHYMTILETFGPLKYNSVLHAVIDDQSAASVAGVEGATGVSRLSLKDSGALLFANEFALAAQKPPFALDYKSTGDYWKGFSLVD